MVKVKRGILHFNYRGGEDEKKKRFFPQMNANKKLS
jgi:hypothetical protein